MVPHNELRFSADHKEKFWGFIRQSYDTLIIRQHADHYQDLYLILCM